MYDVHDVHDLLGVRLCAAATLASFMAELPPVAKVAETPVRTPRCLSMFSPLA
jgi:hypothetical protein